MTLKGLGYSVSVSSSQTEGNARLVKNELGSRPADPVFFTSFARSRPTGTFLLNLEARIGVGRAKVPEAGQPVPVGDGGWSLCRRSEPPVPRGAA
jgi:hypothetical protein